MRIALFLFGCLSASGCLFLRLFSLYELKGFSNTSWLYLVCGGFSSVMVVNWFFWFFFVCPTLAV